MVSCFEVVLDVVVWRSTVVAIYCCCSSSAYFEVLKTSLRLLWRLRVVFIVAVLLKLLIWLEMQLHVLLLLLRLLLECCSHWSCYHLVIGMLPEFAVGTDVVCYHFLN